ncbi:MAG: phosphotransferase [Deltaproteobacteria bacterium]|nr:phosphotransferase [Deltaproteobacteria bacterium]
MMLADFHVHSNLSDGKLPISEVIDLYGQRGFGAIAITDHVGETKTLIGKAAGHLGLCLTPETFSHYLETLRNEADRAWKLYRMVVIPGVELSKNSISNHRSAHILALGVSSYISADGDVLEIAKAIKEQGALSVAAHPVDSGKLEKQTYHLWNRREELARAFDAWEVASGDRLFTEVLQSKLPKIASSDLHIARQMTSWKTVLDCERHPEAILAAIRKQELEFRFYQDGSSQKITCLNRPKSLASEISWPSVSLQGSHHTSYDNPQNPMG